VSATGIAAAHQTQQTALAAATAAATAGLWQHVDPAAVAVSWAQQLPAAVAVVSGAQQFAAAAADPYLEELLDEYDLADAGSSWTRGRSPASPRTGVRWRRCCSNRRSRP